MSEPTQPVDAPEAVDVVAARALAALVVMLHTDPLARPLLGRGRADNPWYWVLRGEMHLDFHDAATGAEQLAAVQALFDRTFTVGERSYSSDVERHVMRTTWQDVPLQVTVEVARENELEAARKRIAELEAAEAHRQALLDEQRRRLLDDVAPDPSAYIATAEVTA